MSSIHYFAAVLDYNFAENSDAKKVFVIYIHGTFILGLSFYLGYRESFNAISYFQPMNDYSDYMKSLGMIVWHIAYYGPTYWIISRSMIGIDYESQLDQ